MELNETSISLGVMNTINSSIEMANNLFEDRNLINSSILCRFYDNTIGNVNTDSNITLSESKDCLRFITSWDTRQQQISDLTVSTVLNDIAGNALPTTITPATVFDNLSDINVTMTLSTTSTQLPEYNWPFLLLSILVFIGGFGNILVCLAIGFERRLQNATNYFLLSLSVADLLVSVVVMPFGILNEFYGIWPFGSTICNVWVTCDVLSCSSSILHMCFISVGRYIGIKNPLHARQAPLLVSRRAVLLKITLAWLLSAVITSPITILALADQTNVQPEPLVCAIANRPFQILGSLSAFFIPMAVMVNSYILTVRLLRKKAKFYDNASHNFPVQDTNESSDYNSLEKTSAVPSSGKNHYGAKRTVSSSSESSAGSHCSTTSGSLQLVANQSSTSSQHDNACSRTSTHGHNNLAAKKWDLPLRRNDMNQRTDKKKKHQTKRTAHPFMIRTLGSSLQVRNEQKATKVLGLVFFSFVICWAPFFLVNFLIGILPQGESNIFPDELTTTFQWLGYISSIINPIIYTIFNRNFRRAFRRIIMCQICGHNSAPNRRFSRTASQKDQTSVFPKKASSSPTHTTASKLYDDASFESNKRSPESNNHHNSAHHYNMPLSWKFKTAARKNNGLGQNNSNIEFSSSVV